MSDFADFDRYCDEHNITNEEAPIAFAAWMHEISGGEWDGEAHRLCDAEENPDRDPTSMEPFKVCRLPFEHTEDHDFGISMTPVNDIPQKSPDSHATKANEP